MSMTVSTTMATTTTNTRAERGGGAATANDEEEEGRELELGAALWALSEGPSHDAEKACCCPGGACGYKVSQCEITASSSSH